MKKVVSVLFSMLLVGFMAMASGALAGDVPMVSADEGTKFGLSSEYQNQIPEPLEGAEMLTHSMAKPIETLEPEGQPQERGLSLPERTQTLDTPASDVRVTETDKN